MKYTVLESNPVMQPADALITLVNRKRTMTRHLDNAIVEVAGTKYHDALALEEPLTDGEAIYLTALQKPTAKFKSVIFVVDAGRLPLNQLVFAGLKEAEELEFRTVTLPLLRTERNHRIERSFPEEVRRFYLGIVDFSNTRPKHLKQLNIVVDGNHDAAEMLRKLLG